MDKPVYNFKLLFNSDNSDMFGYVFKNKPFIDLISSLLII